MSNLIGRSGYHIFIVLKKEKKILKHNNLFWFKSQKILVANRNQKKKLVYKNVILNSPFKIVLSVIKNESVSLIEPSKKFKKNKVQQFNIFSIIRNNKFFLYLRHRRTSNRYGSLIYLYLYLYISYYPKTID